MPLGIMLAITNDGSIAQNRTLNDTGLSVNTTRVGAFVTDGCKDTLYKVCDGSSGTTAAIVPLSVAGTLCCQVVETSIRRLTRAYRSSPGNGRFNIAGNTKGIDPEALPPS